MRREDQLGLVRDGEIGKEGMRYRGIREEALLQGIRRRTENRNALEGGPSEFGGRGGLRAGIGIPQFFADFF